MNDLEKILKKKTLHSSSAKNSIFNNDYESSDNEKDLSYIDKFLKIITNNHKVDILYDNVTTAFMDIKTGNITLPRYVMNDRDIYITMGSHEVSHVLHTPRVFYDKHNKTQTGNVRVDSIDISPLFFYCINVVEDIRIEKIIRRKYPGFVEIYNRASKKILDGLFEVTEDQWNNELTIGDKINIKAKCTNHLQFELTPFEDGVLRYLKKANTFNEVLVKAAYLYELMLDKKDNTDNKDNNKEEELSNESSDTNMGGSSGDGDGSTESSPKQDKFDKLSKTLNESDSLSSALQKVKGSLDTEREEKLTPEELEGLTDNIMDKATEHMENNSNYVEKFVLSKKTSRRLNKSYMNPKNYLK